MDYSQMFDVVKFEKAKAIARFNMFRRIARSRQILEAIVVLGLISWSTARVPAAARTAAGHAVRFSSYLLNHHVVFLIGNAIVVWLFVVFRRNDAADPADAGGDIYDEYVKHSEAASRGDPPPPDAAEGGGGDAEKQIVVRAEEAVVSRKFDDVAAALWCAPEQIAVRAEALPAVAPKSDEVAAAIEKAERQIRRFERTQSARLRREIGARPQSEFRRTESENRRKSVSSVDEMRAEDMERLSSEDFRRTVDAFIDKHWSKKATTMEKNRLGVYNEKYYELLM